MNTLPSTQEMERAFRQRDATYDGIFYLAVRTTGVFCRPSCPARKPLAKNVEFFATVREALEAGYRPCKRCRPLHTDGQPPEWVERLLTTLEQNPEARLTDADLRRMQIDPARARRHFRKHYGLTFQAYARGRRLGQALGQIRRGADLDDVALGNGYESHSGFREAFAQTFGRPPGQSRQADCVVTNWIESPLGPLVLAATTAGICLLEFSDPQRIEKQFEALRRYFGRAIVPGSTPHLEALEAELARYFAGTLQRFSVPLVYHGTPFQEKVWAALKQIPYGETRAYEDIAQSIGAPRAARAVGSANGLNRIAIVIPCHRVVNKNGELGGYGGGLWRKRILLDLEQRGHRPPSAPDREPAAA